MSNDFYEPSPSEIAAECLRIQSGWSVSERQSRMGKTPPPIDSDFGQIVCAATVHVAAKMARRRQIRRYTPSV